MDGEGKSRPNKVLRSAEESIRPSRPDFLERVKKNGEGAGAEKAPTGDYRGREESGGKKYAAQNLGAAERNAGQTGMGAGTQNEEGQTGLDAVRNGENSPEQGYYSGTGKPEPEMSRKERAKGMLKKRGPIASVCITLITLVGMMMFSAGASEIVNWKENIYSMFGQNSAVMNKRSNFVMRKLLKTNKGVKTSIFKKVQFKFNDKLTNKLNKEGIQVVEEGGVTALVAEGEDGRARVVVADGTDIEKVRGLEGTEVEIDGRKVQVSGDTLTLSQAKANDKSFRTKFNNATATFAGKIAGWFDNLADALYKRIAPGARSKTRDFDGDSEEEVKEKMAKNKAEDVESTEVLAKKDQEDEDGNVTKVELDDSDNVDGKTYGEIKNANDGTKAGDIGAGDIEAAKTKLTDRARKAAMGANIFCGFIKAMGSISSMIGALMRTNAIQYAALFLELADKIKAGDSTSATHAMMKQVNETQKSQGYDMKTNTMVDVEGSIADSDGFNAPLAGSDIIEEDDPSAMMSNYESAMKVSMAQAKSGGADFAPILEGLASLGQWGAGVEAFRICTGVQFVTGILDGITDIFFLGAKGLKAFIVEAFQGAAMTGLMAVISLIISMVAPMFAEWAAGQLVNLLFGRNGGFVLYSGAHNTMGSNMQMSTGRYSDRENAVQVAMLTEAVETEWAQHERDTLSPFDTSSIYTFLGSIKNSLLPIINQSGSGIMSTISSTMSLAGSSALAVVSPTASAVEKGANLSFGSEENCYYLSSVGVAGDAMCNKYVGAYVEDLETKNMDDAYQKMADQYNSFKRDANGEIETFNDGNPKISASSNYAKYIVACVTNDVQPGIMSGAVMGLIEQATTTGNAVADGLIGFGSSFIPGGGFLDALDAMEQQSNIVWNSGAACTGKTDDANLNEEVRNYSAYNLDQRVLADMEVIDENSTEAFLEEYYEKNPLDQSFEGQIARFSGLSKEEISDTIALLNYYNYVAKYDPSERYAFGEEQVKLDKPMMVEVDNVTQVASERSVVGILADMITFADVRNRTMAV